MVEEDKVVPGTPMAIHLLEDALTVERALHEAKQATRKRKRTLPQWKRTARR